MMVVVGDKTWKAFLYNVISIGILEEKANLIGESALMNFMRQNNVYLKRSQGQMSQYSLIYIKVLIYYKITECTLKSCHSNSDVHEVILDTRFLNNGMPFYLLQGIFSALSFSPLSPQRIEHRTGTCTWYNSLISIIGLKI